MTYTGTKNSNQRHRLASAFSIFEWYSRHHRFDPALLAEIAQRQQEVKTEKRARRRRERMIQRSLIGLAPVKNKRFARQDNERSY